MYSGNDPIKCSKCGEQLKVPKCLQKEFTKGGHAKFAKKLTILAHWKNHHFSKPLPQPQPPQAPLNISMAAASRFNQTFCFNNQDQPLQKQQQQQEQQSFIFEDVLHDLQSELYLDKSVMFEKQMVDHAQLAQFKLEPDANSMVNSVVQLLWNIPIIQQLVGEALTLLQQQRQAYYHERIYQIIEVFKQGGGSGTTITTIDSSKIKSGEQTPAELYQKILQEIHDTQIKGGCFRRGQQFPSSGFDFENPDDGCSVHQKFFLYSQCQSCGTQKGSSVIDRLQSLKNYHVCERCGRFMTIIKPYPVVLAYQVPPPQTNSILETQVYLGDVNDKVLVEGEEDEFAYSIRAIVCWDTRKQIYFTFIRVVSGPQTVWRIYKEISAIKQFPQYYNTDCVDYGYVSVLKYLKEKKCYPVFVIYEQAEYLEPYSEEDKHLTKTPLKPFFKLLKADDKYENRTSKDSGSKSDATMRFQSSEYQRSQNQSEQKGYDKQQVSASYIQGQSQPAYQAKHQQQMRGEHQNGYYPTQQQYQNQPNNLYQPDYQQAPQYYQSPQQHQQNPQQQVHGHQQQNHQPNYSQQQPSQQQFAYNYQNQLPQNPPQNPPQHQHYQAPQYQQQYPPQQNQALQHQQNHPSYSQKPPLYYPSPQQQHQLPQQPQQPPQPQQQLPQQQQQPSQLKQEHQSQQQPPQPWYTQKPQQHYYPQNQHMASHSQAEQLQSSYSTPAPSSELPQQSYNPSIQPSYPPSTQPHYTQSRDPNTLEQPPPVTQMNQSMSNQSQLSNNKGLSPSRLSTTPSQNLHQQNQNQQPPSAIQASPYNPPQYPPFPNPRAQPLPQQMSTLAPPVPQVPPPQTASQSQPLNQISQGPNPQQNTLNSHLTPPQPTLTSKNQYQAPGQPAQLPSSQHPSSSESTPQQTSVPSSSTNKYLMPPPGLNQSQTDPARLSHESSQLNQSSDTQTTTGVQAPSIIKQEQSGSGTRPGINSGISMSRGANSHSKSKSRRKKKKKKKTDTTSMAGPEGNPQSQCEEVVLSNQQPAAMNISPPKQLEVEEQKNQGLTQAVLGSSVIKSQLQQPEPLDQSFIDQKTIITDPDTPIHEPLPSEITHSASKTDVGATTSFEETKGATPFFEGPKGATSSSEVLKGATPSSEAPKGATPSPEAPKGATSQSQLLAAEERVVMINCHRCEKKIQTDNSCDRNCGLNYLDKTQRRIQQMKENGANT